VVVVRGYTFGGSVEERWLDHIEQGFPVTSAVCKVKRGEECFRDRLDFDEVKGGLRRSERIS
jgi:hypothetical protein